MDLNLHWFAAVLTTVSFVYIYTEARPLFSDQPICRTSQKVEIGPQIFDCVTSRRSICDQTPLFPVEKEKCNKCCKEAVDKSLKVKEVKTLKPVTTKTSTTLGKQNQKKEKGRIEKVSKEWQYAFIALVVIVVVLIIIVVVLIICFFKYRARTEGKLRKARKEVSEKNDQIEELQQKLYNQQPQGDLNQEVASDNGEEEEGLLNGRHVEYVAPG